MKIQSKIQNDAKEGNNDELSCHEERSGGQEAFRGAGTKKTEFFML
jgi:hypothetical protein